MRYLLREQRAQASIEFLVYAVLFTIALSAAFVAISSLSHAYIQQSQRALATSIAERVANAITLISNAPHGTYYYMDLPPTLGRLPYKIELKALRDGSFVVLTYGDESVLALYHGNAVWKCDGKSVVFRKHYNTVEVVCR